MEKPKNPRKLNGFLTSPDLNGTVGSISDLKPKDPGFESRIRQGLYVDKCCGSERNFWLDIGRNSPKWKKFAKILGRNLTARIRPFSGEQELLCSSSSIGYFGST
jgi:hypothetical protein